MVAKTKRAQSIYMDVHDGVNVVYQTLCDAHYRFGGANASKAAVMGVISQVLQVVTDQQQTNVRAGTYVRCPWRGG